jgi:hypothetical protein
VIGVVNLDISMELPFLIVSQIVTHSNGRFRL